MRMNEPPVLERAGISTEFETVVLSALLVVQGSLSKVIKALPGSNRRPVELQRTLGLDYKVCWQTLEVIDAAGALSTSRNVPPSATAARVLAAAARAGVKASLTSAAQDAIDSFNRLIVAHAGDRSAFDAMVTAVCPSDSGGQIELNQRRAAYRAMSHILGRQIETVSGVVIARKGKSNNLVECSNLTRKIGINRLRLDVPAEAFGYSEYPPPADHVLHAEPIDKVAAELYGAPILPEFSTKPLPKFVRVQYQSGWARFERENPGIGKQSAIDLAFGQINRSLELSQDIDGRRIFYAGGTFASPTKMFISDLLVHRPSFGKVQPELLIFEPIAGDDSPAAARRAQHLPMDERLVYLGKGVGVAQTRDLPGHREMLLYAMEMLQWDANDFDVFRLKMPFPVYQSAVRTLFYV